MNIQAPDLTKEFPRSARDNSIGGYVIAARALDKCRAAIAGTNGEYHADCPLDNIWLGFAEIKFDDFREFVSTGADDAAVSEWVGQNAQSRQQIEIIRWNNEWRDKRISDLPDELQEFLETYIPENLPKNRPVYVLFDIYDIEEKRI